jgi:hypothetical protein
MKETQSALRERVIRAAEYDSKIDDMLVCMTSDGWSSFFFFSFRWYLAVFVS